MTGKIKINITGLKIIDQYQSETAPPAFQSMNYFLPPEVLESNNFNPLSADMWSLGCIVYFMATKNLPFNSKDMKFLKEQIKSAEYNNSIIMDNNLKDVISRCLKFEPEARYSVNNLLKMKYFTSYEGKLNRKAYRIKADWRKSVLIFRRSTCLNERTNSQIEIPKTPFRPFNDAF